MYCIPHYLFVQARLLSEDYGKHLMGVEDLLQKHNLLEADINVVGERVKTVNTQAQKFVDGDVSEVGGEIRDWFSSIICTHTGQ